MQAIKIFSGLLSLNFSIFFIVLSLMSFQVNSSNTNIQNQDTCPIANFTVTNNGHLLNTETIFVNQSTGASSYHWNFGDGNTSNAEHPRHTYGETGTYSVTLTAIVDGCEFSIIGIVDVIDA